MESGAEDENRALLPSLRLHLTPVLMEQLECPPSLASLSLCSPPFVFCSHTVSPPFSIPPLPFLNYVLLRKCASAREKLQHQSWAGFKAGVGGGGVYYAWPPTQLQKTIQTYIQILTSCVIIYVYIRRR